MKLIYVTIKIDPDIKSVNMLIKVLQDVIDITSSLPDRSEIDE